MVYQIGSNGSDLEGHSQVVWPFQMQSVEHLCCILHDFN